MPAASLLVPFDSWCLLVCSLAWWFCSSVCRILVMLQLLGCSHEEYGYCLSGPLQSHAANLPGFCHVHLSPTWWFPIIPPMGLLPSWVTIMAGLLDATSSHSHSPSFDCPVWLEITFCGQFNARNQMPVSLCRSLLRLLYCFEISVF